MIFSSVEFIFLYLPITFLLFLFARKYAGIRTVLGLLTLASFFYYSYWGVLRGYWYFSLIFLGSVTFNFLIARRLGPENPWNRPLLVLGLVGNLGLLFYFKYAAFASSIAVELGLLERPLAEKVLPIGISFFTFQQIGLLVDRSKGIAPRISFIVHALYVNFFPHHIAGPIVHHGDVLPQFQNPQPRPELFGLGLFIFAIGLAKKTLIADSLGLLADQGFGAAPPAATLNAWGALLAYHFQLYFDFSGYSDMAVGLALLFGIRFPWNFRSPYKATSISDFWRTWHITLSNFLRVYLFIPLGGSRVGRVRTSINLMITMLLGGIWHGGGWQFVFWGLLHGSALTVNHAFRGAGIRVGKVLGWIATTAVVLAGWVMFRSDSMTHALATFARLFHGSQRWLDPSQMELFRAVPYLGIAALIAYGFPNTATLSERFRPSVRWTSFSMALLALAMFCILGEFEPPEFLYFDF